MIKKSATIGVCPLCCMNERLVDGHIYPRWFYEEFLKNTRSDYVLVIHESPSEFNKKCRTGFSEYIFCANCDNVCISRIEHAAHTHFVRLLQLSKGFTRVKDSVDTLDPKTGENLYLFALSLAIRCILAKGKFFRYVMVDKGITDLLISELRQPEYKVYVLAAYRTDLADLQAVLQPEVIKTEFGECIFIRFGIWQFFVFIETPTSRYIKMLCLGQLDAWPLVVTTNPSDHALVRNIVINRLKLDQQRSSSTNKRH